MIDTARKQETAILIGIVTPKQDEKKVTEYLDELAFLAETAGAFTLKRFTQRLDHPDVRTFLGSGKLEEIKKYVLDNKINLVIFDDELSGSQIRNIEKILTETGKELACRVLDRANLILDIFAKRAKSAQAKTQVELAQYKYLLPRLTRMWTHLERQKGGIGMRGPGETEIETDRRIIREKIARLAEKLKAIEKQSFTQRKQRGEMIRVALVGYTNVGKSTIMNVIAKAEVFAENKLFATLDTTTRKVVIENIPFLLSDTVGFIRKLPHDLIESFKTTLDEVRDADILIHVVDISHPNFQEQIDIVNQTLTEIKAGEKPTLIVFNKIDAYHFIEKEADDLTPSTQENLTLEELKKTWMAHHNQSCIFISAIQKKHLDLLKEELIRDVKKLFFKRYPHYFQS